MNAYPRTSVAEAPADSVHVAGNKVYRLAGADDNPVLQRLLAENSMDSWIRLSLERQPDYFAAEGLMGESRTVLAHQASDPAQVLGMYTCRRLPVHVNGKKCHAGYLGELRVADAARHRIGVVRDGFASIPRLMPPDWSSHGWFTSVASENQAARRLLEAGLPGMPHYRPIGELETLVFSTRRGKVDGRWQPAKWQDIPALADFYNCQATRWQFAPALEERWLSALDGRNGLSLPDFRILKNGPDVHGCIAIWDQRRFKQTVVRGYKLPLNILREPYNIWAHLTRRPALPRPGQQLDSVYLAFAAIENLNPANMLAGVRNALAVASQKDAALSVLGMSTLNPLLAFLKRELGANGYQTCIESVDVSGNVSMSLDHRPAQPEVAVL